MKKSVSIIGLGYVGLPLACLCAEKGYAVLGVDIDQKRLQVLSKGISPIEDALLSEQVKKFHKKIEFTNDVKGACSKSEIVIVCVPTPVDSSHAPDLRPLTLACGSVSEGLKEGAMVIIESTIFPGTVEEIVLPILHRKQKKLFVGHCPERIDPGNKKYTVRNLPRVVGGIDSVSTKKIAEFYRSIIEADIVELGSVKAAEATKIMENTFRDVNIAFMNEMAKSFDKAGIDVNEVIKGASTKPFGFLPHYPGAGVGGHCIAVDPYYLIAKAKQMGFSHDFLMLARKINESMPSYTVDLLDSEVRKIGESLKGSSVGILGLAYKGNVDDTRESPAYEVIKALSLKGAHIEVFDPYVPKESSVKSVDALLSACDYIVLVTDHKEFKAIDPSLFKKKEVRVIIDGRNCLDAGAIKKLGIAYHGIGRQ